MLAAGLGVAALAVVASDPAQPPFLGFLPPNAFWIDGDNTGAAGLAAAGLGPLPPSAGFPVNSPTSACGSTVVGSCTVGQTFNATMTLLKGAVVDANGNFIAEVVAHGEFILENARVGIFKYLNKEVANVTIKDVCGHTPFGFAGANPYRPIDMDGALFDNVASCTRGAQYGGVVALASFKGAVSGENATFAILEQKDAHEGEISCPTGTCTVVDASSITRWFGALYESEFVDVDAALDEALFQEASLLGFFFALAVISLFIAHTDLIEMVRRHQEKLRKKEAANRL